LALKRTSEDPWNAPLPGGESLGELRERFLSFVADLPPGRHLVVTHAGVVRVAVFLALGLKEGQPWRLVVPNASLTEVDLAAKRAGPIGDACHLEGGEGGA